MEKDKFPDRSNEVIIRELIWQLINDPINEQREDFKVFREEIPAEIKMNLIIPEDARLLGTLKLGPNRFQVMFDINISPAEVYDSYREELTLAGWSEIDVLHNRGFSNTILIAKLLELGLPEIKFYHPTLDYLLIIKAFIVQEGLTSVDLHLNTKPINPTYAETQRRRINDILDLIPALEPPIGAIQTISRGQVLNNSATSTGRVEAISDIQGLAVHYAAQLAQAGWKCLSGESNEITGWHAWEFQDKNKDQWHGSFIIFKFPETKRDYFVQIEIQRIKETPDRFY